MKKPLIISRENAEYQVLDALKRNRSKRNKLGELFVEGIESIKQADAAGAEITRLIYSKDRTLSQWAKDLIDKNSQATIIEMEDSLYKKLCDRESPSELVITAKIQKYKLEDIRGIKNPFILIFDRPSDLGNLGTILRSANSFKVDAILILGHGVDVYDPKVIRSSLGSLFHLPVLKIESFQELDNWVQDLKSRNDFKVIGTDSTGDISLMNHDLKKPLALVLGNEAKGMSQALQELCDFIVSIPLSGQVNSLNVSCAGSILLWEIFKGF